MHTGNGIVMTGWLPCRLLVVLPDGLWIRLDHHHACAESSLLNSRVSHGKERKRANCWMKDLLIEDFWLTNYNIKLCYLKIHLDWPVSVMADVSQLESVLLQLYIVSKHKPEWLLNSTARIKHCNVTFLQTTSNHGKTVSWLDTKNTYAWVLDQIAK